jgi:hypothetical protein
VWPSGTDSASPTFNATFFDAGEYIIQVNVTATIKHLGGSTTTLNATGYIGGSQSDIANVETEDAQTPQQKTGTSRVTVTAATGDTYAELILINVEGTPFHIQVHHMYIQFNQQNGSKAGTKPDSYGFWPKTGRQLTIAIDGPGEVEHPDGQAPGDPDGPTTAGQGHPVASSSDPVFVKRLRKLCDQCVKNPPFFGLSPTFYVCASWANEVWFCARWGCSFIYPVIVGASYPVSPY